MVVRKAAKPTGAQVKIAVISESMTNNLAGLGDAYQLCLLQAGEAIPEVELGVYDTCLGTDNIELPRSVPWIAVNEKNIYQIPRFFQAGFSGVMGCEYSPEQMKNCIEAVKNGDYYIDSDFMQIIAMRQIKKMLVPFSELTSREFDVFCLLAEGCTVAEIADELGLTSKTIFNAQTRIKNKLGLANIKQMKQFAIKNGLLK